MPDDVQAQGSGRVWGLGFGVRKDVASASGSLHQLVFHVRNLVVGGEHVVRSNGKTSGEARGL